MKHLSSGIVPMTIAALALIVMTGGPALADKPPADCKTSGPLKVDAPSPPNYTYEQGVIDSQAVTVTVTSPDMPDPCEGTPVFGNGSSGGTLPVTFSFGKVTDVTDGGSTVLTAGEAAVILAAFGSPAVSPNPFDLTPPGTGTYSVSLTFANSASIPPGDYLIEFDMKPKTGVGVGDPNPVVFALTVTAPTSVDTLAPEVTINSPAPSDKMCLNGNLSVNFTAKDPPEGDAGTGVTAVGATIDSLGGVVIDDDISALLDVSPTLPVAADVLVTATADVPQNDIGSFILTTTADDNAGHQGVNTVNFSVAVNVSALPPISLAGRQFKAGSTVPIKWKLTDCDGLFLPPFESVKIEIYDSEGLLETRHAGDGADNIRWELDDFGNATQYITNFELPAAGPYTVKVFVNDIDDNSVEQDSFEFLGASKGGKS